MQSNEISVAAQNTSAGPAGLIAKLVVKKADGGTAVVVVGLLHLDAPGHGLLALGHRHGEDAVLQPGADLVRVHRAAQGEAALEAAAEEAGSLRARIRNTEAMARM